MPTHVFGQVQAVPDTIVAHIIPPDPSWFAQVTSVAAGILTLVPFALLVVLIWATFRLKRAFEHARTSLEDVRKDLQELIGAANRIGDDLAGVSHSVRSSVNAVTETVTYTNERAQHAVSRLADRVDAFNDALEVVQDDTQDVIVSALAALRGVRAGVAAFRKPPRKRRKVRRDEELEADDDDDEFEPPDLPARPRLRRRARAAE